MRHLLVLAFLVQLACAGEVKTDERVVFFATGASLDATGERWTVPIHGWIFEPERDSVWRRKAIREIQDHLGVAPDSADGKRCADRAALFLADNERGKRVRIRIAGQEHELGPSGPDGHFRSTLTLAANAVARHAKEGVLRYEGDAGRFAGRVLLPPPSGIAVISDIDDTIKISHVLDRKELMRRTFAKPFEAVPGMAKAYAAWAKRGATFHYVSSSPWQLYPPLASFLSVEGFPEGAFHMKSVRLKDKTLLSLFKSSLETKPPVIAAILKRHPRHRFVLVGDSGEKDPEVYGLVARQHPGRIVHAYIRRVPGADNGDDRFRRAFDGVDAAKWTVFREAAELKPG